MYLFKFEHFYLQHFLKKIRMCRQPPCVALSRHAPIRWSHISLDRLILLFYGIISLSNDRETTENFLRNFEKEPTSLQDYH